VVGYNSYYGPVSGGPYTKLTGASVPNTDYDATNLQGGQTRYYVVISVNSSNEESAYSKEVSL